MAAALLGLVDDEQKAVESLNEIGIPGVEYRLSKVTKCGILGNHLSVIIGGKEEVAEDGDAEHHEGHNHVHELHHDGDSGISAHFSEENSDNEQHSHVHDRWDTPEARLICHHGSASPSARTGAGALAGFWSNTISNAQEQLPLRRKNSKEL